MRLPTFTKTQTINWLRLSGFSDEINTTAFHRETIFTRTSCAVAAAIAAYLLSGYLPAIYTAIDQLTRTQTPPPHTNGFYIEDITTLTATALAGVLLYRLLLVALDARFIAPDRAPMAKLRRVIGRAGLYVVIVVCTGLIPMSLVAALLHTDASSPPIDARNTAPLVHGLIKATTAGFNEEIFLVALPVLLLRAVRVPRRVPWWAIIAPLAAVRVLFHIYYGWPAIGYIPWAVAAILFFRYTHSVAPLIIGHSFVDLVVNSRELISSIPWPIPALVLAVFVGVVCELGMSPRTNQTGTEATTPARCHDQLDDHQSS